MSAMSLKAWESVTHELVTRHEGSRQMCDYTSALLNLCINFYLYFKFSPSVFQAVVALDCTVTSRTTNRSSVHERLNPANIIVFLFFSHVPADRKEARLITAAS